MTTPPPARCPRCGAPVAPSSLKCPRCGGVQLAPASLARPVSGQPGGPPPRSPSQAPSPSLDLAAGGGPPGSWGPPRDPPRPFPADRVRPASAHPPPKPVPWALVTVGTVLAAAAIVAIAWLAYPRAVGGEVPADAAATTDGQDAPPRNDDDTRAEVQRTVEATELLGRAKARALEWNRDAVLVMIRADPIVAGRVPLGGEGKVDVVFGIPSGKLGPGARVGKERLTVTFTGSATSTTTREDTAPSRGVADPACTGNDAWRAAVASGVPSNARTALTYVSSEKHGRAVWQAESAMDPKLNRTIDGQRCTILTR